MEERIPSHVEHMEEITSTYTEKTKLEEVYDEFTIHLELLESFQGKSSIPINVVKDFDTFLKYMANNKVNLNCNKKHISRRHLESLYKNFIIQDGYKKTLCQEQLPLVHFFYEAALYLKVCKIGKGNILKVTSRVQRYLFLSQAEKYTLLFSTLWDGLNWGNLLPGNYSGRPNISQNLRNFSARALLGFPIGEEILLEACEGKNFTQFSFAWNMDVFQIRLLPLLKHFELIDFTYKSDRSQYEIVDEVGVESISVKKLGNFIFSYYGNQPINLKSDEAIENNFYKSIFERLFSKKIGRNEKCACGSRRKFKKCCGKSLDLL